MGEGGGREEGGRSQSDCCEGAGLGAETEGRGGQLECWTQAGRCSGVCQQQGFRV